MYASFIDSTHFGEPVMLPRTLFVLLLGLPLPGRAADPPAKAKHPFEPGKVWPVHITLDAKEFAAMQPKGGFGFPGFGGPPPKNPPPADPARKVHRNNFGMDLPWATGSVTIGDQTFEKVGIRYKGNGTIGDASHTIKKSIKIDLDLFGGTGKFFAAKSVNLHCEVTDPSKCRERIGYDLYRAAGVPAPRTALAEVTLTVPGKFDKELLGVYTLVENVDKNFLQNHFGTDKGLLMKPEGYRDFDYRGDNWEPYKKPLDGKRDATDAEAKRLIAFAKLVHRADDATFRKEVGGYIDVDGYLRFLAVTAFISNTDSIYVGGHNYYLYLHPKTNKLHVLPWDLDRAFANFPILGTNAQQMNMNFQHPYGGTHKFTERLLAAPGMADKYKTLLKELAGTVFAKDKLLKELAAAEAEVKELLARDVKAAAARKEVARGGMPGFGKPPEMVTFIEKRTASLAAQLAGTSKGFTPAGGFGQPPKFGDMMAGPMLEARDTDKDGKLSKDEWVATAKRVFEVAEKDKDDKVTERGIADAINKLWPTPEGQPRGFGGPGQMLAGPIVQRADADKDKKLTQDEMVAAAKALFDEFDKAKAGKIDDEVFAEMLNALFPPQRFGPPPGGPGGPGPGGPPPEPKKG